MQAHKINLELSEKIFYSFQHYLQPNQCYNNVFELTVPLCKEFAASELKIAIGYMSNGLFFMRHAYLVDKDGFAVDPSILFTYQNETSKTEDFEYYTLITMNTTEYLDLLVENNNKPNLKKVLAPREKEFAKYLRDNRLLVIEDDYEEYLKGYDKANRIMRIPNLLERLRGQG